ncbi:MAG TPA: hypothetical protein VFR86_26200 [Burkholderiaceae bacterium]|nr:hypothetical protein [Burkholderiaceae bacterium]
MLLNHKEAIEFMVDLQAFRGMLDAELQHLEVHNCARYRLPFGKTQEWIAKGRPS